MVALLAVGGLWFYFFAGGKYLKGEEFKIILNENNSVGYNWVYELSNNDIVSVEKNQNIKPSILVVLLMVASDLNMKEWHYIIPTLG